MRTREQDRAYQRVYRERNRERVRAINRAKMKRWQAANKDKVSARNKAYYRANKERERARNKARYYQDVEAAREYFRAWRKANPGKTLAAVKGWLRRNPEYKAAVDKLRRARRAGLKSERIDLAVLAARQKHICPWCGKKMKPADFSLDHIVPIASGAAGGATHTYANVQLLHLLCNASKGARFGAGVQPYLELTL